jgi:hypothetical protein
MHVIYCLRNESFKENILYVGITTSIATLTEIVEEANQALLPTPYTIFLTKTVYNENRIDILCSLLSKFGNQLNDHFFDIPPETVKELFDLIYDEPVDLYENIKQEKYRIVQEGTEYIIPKVDESEYAVSSNNADPYDRLYSFKHKTSINSTTVNQCNYINEIDL